MRVISLRRAVCFLLIACCLLRMSPAQFQ
uniref:Uncharacterized protein n=1 Tax=Rhizophora mucronata TaxID=61149 RepID=A0A2P2PFE0_RHIMU